MCKVVCRCRVYEEGGAIVNMSKSIVILAAIALTLPALLAAAQAQVSLADPASSAPTDLQKVIIINDPDNFTIHVYNVLRGATNIFQGFPTTDIPAVEVVVFRVLVDLDSNFSTGGHVRVVVGDDPTPLGPKSAIVPGVDLVVLAYYFHWNNSVAGGKGTGIVLTAYDPQGAKASGSPSDPASVIVNYTETDVTLTLNASKLLAEYTALTGQTLNLDPTFYVLRSPGAAPAYFAYINVGYGEVASVFARPHLRDSASATGYTVPQLGSITIDGDAADWQSIVEAANISDSYAAPNPYNIDLKLAVVAANSTHLGLLVENVGDLNYKVLDAADGLRADWVLQVKLTVGGTTYQLDFSNRVLRVLDSANGVEKFIAAGNGYTLNDNLDAGVLEILVDASLLPFTLAPGDTIDVTVTLFRNYVDFITGTTTLIFKNYAGAQAELAFSGAHTLLGPGAQTIQLGPAALAINASAPIQVNATLFDGYIPYPVNATLPAPVQATIFFAVNDTNAVQWPINITYTAPVNVKEILYYVKGQGLQPLPKEAYTIKAGPYTTVTITLNSTLYQQGDPLIAILGTPTLIGGELATEDHASPTPLIAIAALLLALLAAKKR